MGSNNSQSENIELEAMCAIHQSASDKLTAALGLRFEQISGVVCSASSVEPSILVNRCFVTDDNTLTEPLVF